MGKGGRGRDGKKFPLLCLSGWCPHPILEGGEGKEALSLFLVPPSTLFLPYGERRKAKKCEEGRNRVIGESGEYQSN